MSLFWFSNIVEVRQCVFSNGIHLQKQMNLKINDGPQLKTRSNCPDNGLLKSLHYVGGNYEAILSTSLEIAKL